MYVYIQIRVYLYTCIYIYIFTFMFIFFAQKDTVKASGVSWLMISAVFLAIAAVVYSQIHRETSLGALLQNVEDLLK